MGSVTFDKALEIIESLPEEQRESIIEIVKLRLAEERRERLAQMVKQAREELKSGQVRRGTVDDLMRVQVYNSFEMKIKAQSSAFPLMDK